MENKQSLNDFMAIHISAYSIQNGKFEPRPSQAEQPKKKKKKMKSNQGGYELSMLFAWICFSSVYSICYIYILLLLMSVIREFLFVFENQRWNTCQTHFSRIV